MYQSSPILGVVALAGFGVCVVGIAVSLVLWIVERYWIPQSTCDESWLYGEIPEIHRVDKFQAG